MNIEQGSETKPAPKKKTKPKKRAAAPPRKVVADGIYAGMSVKDCCKACDANGCVISGKGYCAHPRKGGLHAADLQDSAAMGRRREAEKVLGRQKLVVAE